MRYPGLNPEYAADAALMARVQMGVLKSHGREFSSYLLLNFGTSAGHSIRAFLRDLPIRSAFDQAEDGRAFRVDQTIERGFFSVALSASCYRKLGLTGSCVPTDQAFRRGMKWASANVLSDPDPRTWDPFYRDDVDAIITLASSDKTELAVSEQQHVKRFEAIMGQVARWHIERGYVIRNASGDPIEHFGFADGISHPLFFERDIDEYVAMTNGVTQYDPSYDPRTVILAEAYPFSGAYGSYLCFRKIEQDVGEFRALSTAIASNIGATEDWIGSCAIGRYRTGTALATSSPGNSFANGINNFNYTADPHGVRCPLHAHVRKMNQRESMGNELFQVVSRRGVLYKEDGGDSIAIGLLFMCFQRDLAFQFEVLQSRWASDPLFPVNKGRVGVDPVIGVVRNPTNAQQHWSAHWGDSATGGRELFANVVKLRGGEYFYAPPPEFFLSI